MGNRINRPEEEETIAIRPALSRPIRNFQLSIKPAKAIFSKLSPKPQNIDDQLSIDNSEEGLFENVLDEQNLGPECSELGQSFQEESVAEEIKIKWNSFIKMKKKNYLDQYTVLHQIGKGGFGTVSKVKAKFTGVIRAAKKIKKASLGKEEHEKLFEQMAIMINLDHPNITRLFQVYDYKSSYVLILELCEGGELFKRIVQKATNQAIAIPVIAQLLQALIYVHGRGIVHRDLKPENLLFEKGSNYLKLIDFGIAVEHKGDEPLTARIGTPYYIAPEVLCKKYGQKCDLWSVGVILYMMLTFRPPFSGQNQLEVMEKIIKVEPSYELQSFDKVSPEAKDFLKQLLTKNPNKRPSAYDAYRHPWIQNYITSSQLSFHSKTRTLDNLVTFKFASKLQAVVYTYIVSQILSSEEKEFLKKVFEQLDDNHDGVISTAEFKQALLKKKQLSDERIKFLVRIIDTNGSGEIDFTEFIVAALEPEALTVEHFEQAFSYFDIDHSGMITYDQIAAFLEDKESSEEEIRKIFKEVDENSDNEISKEEFLHLLLKRTKERQEDKLKLRKNRNAKERKATQEYEKSEGLDQTRRSFA